MNARCQELDHTCIDEVGIIYGSNLAFQCGFAELVLLVGILRGTRPHTLQPFLRHDIAHLQILKRFPGQGQDLVHLVV